jgi:DNA-directed RNA polymerase specialized sigma subunit
MKKSIGHKMKIESIFKVLLIIINKLNRQERDIILSFFLSYPDKNLKIVSKKYNMSKTEIYRQKEKIVEKINKIILEK